MADKKSFDLFVGSKSGLLKGINIGKTSCKVENISDVKTLVNNHELSAISWLDQREKELLIGHHSNKKNEKGIAIYDTEKSIFTRSFTCNNADNGPFTDVTSYKDMILTATECGKITLWKDENDAQLLIEAGNNLNKMAHSKINKNIIATGGKEHKLKLFDLEKGMKIYEEKNLPHDWLEMRLPLWISDIGFLQDSSKLATCSRYGYIRTYDFRAQRRPIINLEMKEQALMKLAVVPGDKHIIVGSGSGKMNLIDLRNPGRILNTYKDFVGSITGITCTQLNPYVISVSLDRHLRIHHLHTKQLLYKVYLTSRLNSMVVRSDISLNMVDKFENERQSKVPVPVDNIYANNYLTLVSHSETSEKILATQDACSSNSNKNSHVVRKKMKLK